MKKRVEPKEPEGEVLFATVNDPEGMLAGDLCKLLFARCRASAETRPVAGRKDAFLIILTRIDDYYRSFYLPDVLPEWSREVGGIQYPETVPLGFDPATVKDKQIRRIWRDDLTRSLWTGLRFGRIVSQYFNDSVEALAARVRELQAKKKFNRRALNAQFRRMECFGSAELTGVVAAALFPYLTGEKTFSFKVEERK